MSNRILVPRDKVKPFLKGLACIVSIIAILIAILYVSLRNFTTMDIIGYKTSLIIVSANEYNLPPAKREFFGDAEITIDVSHPLRKCIVFKDVDTGICYTVYGDDVYYTYKDMINESIDANVVKYIYKDENKNKTKITFKRYQ